MVVVTLSELIEICMIGIFIVGFILYIIIASILNTYKEKSKKWNDCKKCKYHRLYDTPRLGGDECRYKCEKGHYDEWHKHNDIIWTKCKEFQIDDGYKQ